MAGLNSHLHQLLTTGAVLTHTRLRTHLCFPNHQQFGIFCVEQKQTSSSRTTNEMPQGTNRPVDVPIRH